MLLNEDLFEEVELTEGASNAFEYKGFIVINDSSNEVGQWLVRDSYRKLIGTFSTDSDAIEYIDSLTESLNEDRSFKQNPKKALKTLEKIKKIYEDDDSEVLVASFYSDFMSLLNDQISQIKSTMNVSESLNEDISDVVEIEIPDVVTNITQEEITPKGPEVGEDTGVANAILDLINSENSTIADYNGFIATVADSHPEFISVIEDISNEENNHVGMLTQLLKQISPNVETIKQGESEAARDLRNDVPSLEDTVDFEVDDSFGDGFGGIFV